MGEEKSRSLTRTEFEAVMKRASELAVSDPYDGQSTLDEAEVFRIASEVGLPHEHVRRALAEMRSNENPTGIIDRWFGAPQVWGSRVVRASKEDLRRTLDEFLVAGNLLEAVRQGTDLLLYRPAVDWISHFARAGASLSRRRPLGRREGDRDPSGGGGCQDHPNRNSGGSRHTRLLHRGCGVRQPGSRGWYGPRRGGASRRGVGAPSDGGVDVRQPIGRCDCDCHGADYRSLFPESAGGGSAGNRGGA